MSKDTKLVVIFKYIKNIVNEINQDPGKKMY